MEFELSFKPINHSAEDYQYGQIGRNVMTYTSGNFPNLSEADLVIGAVLVPGGSAPKLVTKDMLKKMQPGSVMVDVAIDQGGCFETSRATSHQDPTYVVDGIVHYCVTNMLGAVPRTAACALNNATLPFILDIANKGAERAIAEDVFLAQGLNVYKGDISYEAVAHDLDMPYVNHQAEILKSFA